MQHALGTSAEAVQKGQPLLHSGFYAAATRKYAVLLKMRFGVEF